MIYTPRTGKWGEPPAIYKLDSIRRAGGARGGREPGVGRLANATDPLNVVKRAICGRFALHKKTICVMRGRFLEQIQT